MFDLSTLSKDQLDSVRAIQGFLHSLSIPRDDKLSCRDYLALRAKQLEISGDPREIVASAIAQIMFRDVHPIPYKRLYEEYDAQKIVEMIQAELENIARKQSPERRGGRG